MTREDAIARLKEAEPELRAHGAAAVYLFGSVARDEARDGSDVDVFVDPASDRPFGFAEFMAVYEVLRERLGGDVDYTTREGLHRRLRPMIEATAVRVF
jgi:hypothetical protein